MSEWKRIRVNKWDSNLVEVNADKGVVRILKRRKQGRA